MGASKEVVRLHVLATSSSLGPPSGRDSTIMESTERHVRTWIASQRSEEIEKTASGLVGLVLSYCVKYLHSLARDQFRPNDLTKCCEGAGRISDL